MSIDKLDYSTAVIEALQGAYRQDWCLTNWTGTGKPLLPAGMIISILGYPYLVSGGDETPDDPAADGAVYLKITPDAPAGVTATAEYTNTFSGTWNEAYNGFYDGDSLFLNVFMTKTGANWTAKGTWLNFRERKLALISDGLTVEGALNGANGVFSGNIQAANGIFTATLKTQTSFDVEPIGTNDSDVQVVSDNISVADLSLGQIRNYTLISNSSTTRTITMPSTAGRLYEVIGVIQNKDIYRKIYNPSDVITEIFGSTDSRFFSVKRIL